jgi:hypothetical protein
MSEVGPALTSPTQFEVTLAEEDEGEDADSESSQFRSSFLSSPLAIQADATELASWPEAPTPQSVHRSSNHPHSSPKVPHRSTGRPPPEKSTRFSTALPPWRQSEQSGTQYLASEPLLHPSTPHHGILIQGGHGSLENYYTLWDMDRTSTSSQLQAGHSHLGQTPSRQQDTTPPHSVPEWQFAHTQSSAYPLQFDPSSHPGSGCLLQPFQADDRTRFIPMTTPSSSHCFTIPLPRQTVAIDSSWDHESSITMIPDIAHPRNPMIPPWPSGSVLPTPSFPEPLQNSGSPPDPWMFYHLVSDHHRESSHPDFLDTSANTEGCTLLSLDKSRGDQFSR